MCYNIECTHQMLRYSPFIIDQFPQKISQFSSEGKSNALHPNATPLLASLKTTQAVEKPQIFKSNKANMINISPVIKTHLPWLGFIMSTLMKRLFTKDKRASMAKTFAIYYLDAFQPNRIKHFRSLSRKLIHHHKNQSSTRARSLHRFNLINCYMTFFFVLLSLLFDLICGCQGFN